MPAPQPLPADLIEEGHTIPIARVQAMHEGKRRARARRTPQRAARRRRTAASAVRCVCARAHNAPR